MRAIAAALALLVVVPVAYGQEAEPQQAPAPAEAAPAAQPGREAISRGSRPQESNARTGTAVRRSFGVPRTQPMAVTPATESVPGASSTEAAQSGQGDEQERRAVPRGSRPQDDNPRTGTAIPRSPLPPATSPRGASTTQRRGAVTSNRGATVVRPPVRNHYSYPYSRGYYYPYQRHYYPRYYYPYGYGAFGLGFFYYNPYRWAPGYTAYYGGYYQQPFSTFDIGELRLDVSPRHAQVFVDGYYAGQVDDFDGAFQAIKLEAGTYRIEISAPGYETLSFDVRITPAQKIRYQGELRRLP